MIDVAIWGYFKLKAKDQQEAEKQIDEELAKTELKFSHDETIIC